MWKPWVLVLAAAAAGCGSSEPSRAPSPRDLPARAPDDRVISISPEVNAQLTDWMAEDVTVIGDVVEIDATRIPFASQVAIEATRETDRQGNRLVERAESTDPATGVTSLTLTNRSGFTTTIETLPRVRLGGGRQFIASDHIVVRYVPFPGVAHPVSLAVTATGRARLIATGSSPPRRLSGSAIVLRADIAQGAAGYEFRSAEETRP